MRWPRTPGRPIQLYGWVRVDITRLGALRGVQCHIGGVVAFAGFLPFCFSGLRVSPVGMSSLNLFISSQLSSKNAANPTHARTLRHPAGLQEYALHPVGVLPKNEPFPSRCAAAGCWCSWRSLNCPVITRVIAITRNYPAITQPKFRCWVIRRL